MRFIERLRRELAQARRLKASRGLAMLLVVIVLSTLLVVGVLFTATANLDLQASAYYRQAAQAELYALEGLYRAMAELYYDVWGVNETQAFKCAEPDWPETAVPEDELADAAYYTTKSAPGPYDSSGEVKAPWAKYRRSVVPSITTVRQGQMYPIFNDLRWMIGQGDPTGTQMYIGKDRPDSGVPFLQPGTHSGAPFHDEFLPEATDNSDVWELGLHLNHGDIFGRDYYNDEDPEGGRWRNPPSSACYWPRVQKYWPDSKNTPSGGRPDTNSNFDYIDTRIVGDSFYKIFRFELIDPQTKRSYAAGMDPVTGNYVNPKFTHLGDASSVEYGVDTHGRAVNINQVNNNYQWELYWGWDVAAALAIDPVQGDKMPATMDDYQTYHYNESKWIYVYNTEGDEMLGRYAVMVWPDCGHPNANLQYDTTEVTQAVGSCTADYFRSLDWGYTPQGGFIGGMVPVYSARVSTVDNIVSEVVEGSVDVTKGWHWNLGARVGEYKDGEGDFAATGGGLINSRAELNLFIRKACFTDLVNGGDPDPVVDGWTHEEAAWDAYILSSLVTLRGYEYLLDHHWAKDRLVIDKLGLTDDLIRMDAQTGVNDPLPIRSETSFFSNTVDGQATRARYESLLDELRFTHGPDGVREGTHTQYHDPKNVPWMSVRAKIAKATPISWLANFWFRPGLSVEHARRPYGVSFAGGVASWKDMVTPADVSADQYLVTSRDDYLSLSEVGKCIFPTADEIVNTYKLQEPWGWRDRYDPTGGGAPSQVYFDGVTPKYFIEVAKWAEINYRWDWIDMDENWHLLVNGRDILWEAGYTTRVIGLDDRSLRGGYNDRECYARPPEYYSSPQNDWTPKVTPAEEAILGRAPSADHRGGDDPSLPPAWATDQSVKHFTKGIWAGQAMANACGVGPNNIKRPMTVFTLNKAREGTISTYGGLPESYTRAYAGNYLVITFDRNVLPDAGGNKTTIVLARRVDGTGPNAEKYVVDVAHLPSVAGYSNVFECGFDARDPVNNHYSEDEGNGGWAPNFLNQDPDRASPAWRGRYGFKPSQPGSPATHWHNLDKHKFVSWDKTTWAWCCNPDYDADGTPDDFGDPPPAGTSVHRARRGCKWLDGLNYHSVMAYLPGGEHAPVHPTKYPFTVSDEMDWTGATSTVACGSNITLCTWDDFYNHRFSGWDRLVKAPTGFWAERNYVLESVVGGVKYAPDPFLRSVGDLTRVTMLDRLITPGYLGARTDSISRIGLHIIYDEADNDMDGHIDNLTKDALAGGAPGHYMADRMVMGRLNMNEMQHPAAIWYGGFCNSRFGSQTLFAGRKPFKGYTSWFECLTRGSYYKESGWGTQADTPYNMIFWYENQWGDISSDHLACTRMGEESIFDTQFTSRMLHSGNSPVYTVYATGQVLRDSEDPIAETKLRATVERTWDGKMNILEFCWIPKDIMEE